MPEAWVDGVAASTLAISDRGLHYGDGLFETLAVREGFIPHLERHLARLERDAHRLYLPAPDLDALRAELGAAAQGQARAVLKLIYTAGSGGRGYRRAAQLSARRILLRYPWPQQSGAAALSGIRVRVCDTRLARQPQLAGIKHLNRLEHVLARREWGAEGADVPAEGLLLDTADQLIEGTRSNVFLARAGLLATPDLKYCGVAGIARELILEHAARLGISCTVRALELRDLAQAEEVFVCNSINGLWPVIAWEAHHFDVGPITRVLQDAWAANA